MEKLLKNDDLYLKTHIHFYTVYRQPLRHLKEDHEVIWPYIKIPPYR